MNVNKGYSDYFRRAYQSICTEGLIYWKDKYNEDVTKLLDKSDAVNDADLKGAAIQLTSTSVSTFTNDVLLYVDRVLIRNSADNITWAVDADKDIIYTIDTVARTFTIDAISHYYSDIELQTLDGEYVTFCRWLNSSKHTEESNIIDESQWLGSQAPFGYFRTGVEFQTGLIFTS